MLLFVLLLLFLQSAGMFYVSLSDANGVSVPFPIGFSLFFTFDPIDYNATDIAAGPLYWFRFNTTSGKWEDPVPIGTTVNGRRLQSAADIIAMQEGYWNAGALLATLVMSS